ncbi:hypothetical protein AB0J40_10250 [Amycolatopsis sp. NPDC049691]|uniref:hypothetical protein n=1 Tax=Amycolatopsis sp. NPDC049691 TaxID=3155155 RepID=UPI0034286A28
MGGDRRSPRRRALKSPFPLAQQSQKFSDDLAALLNRTVCRNVKLSSVISNEKNPRSVVGYQITKHVLDARVGIPLTVDNKAPRLFLGLSYRLAPDSASRYLMVVSSALVVTADKDLSEELFHYDYERNKSDGYPEAHLQIVATSDAWRKACTRPDGTSRKVARLHFPVGPRRFRPTIEDLIEFLIVERLTPGHPGWAEIVESSRETFRIKQLRAAIRNDPETARRMLEEIDGQS